MTSKERYHYLKSQGKCIQCQAPSEGKAYCDRCAKLAAQKRKKRYDKCEEEHKCVTCGKPLPENYERVRCSLCTEKNINHLRESRQKRKMEILKKYRKKKVSK